MAENASEAGMEVVLDNRKLIIAFVLLVAILGCAFVVGFVEGKRQGYQEGIQAAADSMPSETSDSTQAQATQPAGSSPVTEASKEKPEEQPLDWYKTVNRKEGEPDNTQKIMPAPPKKEASGATADAAAKPKTPTAAGTASTISKTVDAPSTETAAGTAPKPAAAAAGPVTYSVQVGAFRQKSESDVKARTLKAKGFDCRVEPPGSAGQLYLVKVGNFKSRADAVAMQLRLKKSGFTSFIKTN